MYGPNLSELAAVAIRRLAWAMESNMGKAIAQAYAGAKFANDAPMGGQWSQIKTL
jgi:hypothetical protein